MPQLNSAEMLSTPALPPSVVFCPPSPYNHGLPAFSVEAPRGMTMLNRSFGVLILGVLMIGLAPISVRVSPAGPIATAMWRMGLAVPALFMLGHFAQRSQTNTAPSPRMIGYFVLSGFFITGDLVLWHLSIEYTTLAIATLAVNTAPLFVTIGSLWLFGEPIRRGFLVGFAITLLGLGALSFKTLDQAGSIIGIGLALGGAVFYAGYILSLRFLREVNTSQLMLWNTASSAVILMGTTALSQEVVFPTTWSGWLPLLILAWVVHVGGQSLIATAIKEISASVTAIMLLLQPVIATLVAWVWFDENLSLLQGTGVVLILVGIYLAKQSASTVAPIPPLHAIASE